jgi:hypothetical protein
MGRICSTHSREGNLKTKVFIGTNEGKRLFGRCRRRWKDNFKIDLNETEKQVERGARH